MAGKRNSMAVKQSSESNEWYTPAEYLEVARRVLGPIDLDPASCAFAQQTVQAARYFTAADDGLAQPWHAATLWLNPPYGGLHPTFIKKLISEYEIGHVKQAILLINAEVGADWFQPLWHYPVCLKHGRIKFMLDPNRPKEPGEKEPSAPSHYNAFVYFGPHVERFTAVFHGMGRVVPALAPLQRTYGVQTSTFARTDLASV